MKFDEPPAAGDNTEKADVSGWATDYVEITLDKADPELPLLSVTHKEGGSPLAVQLVLATKGGSLLKKDMGDIPPGASRQCALKEVVAKEGLSAKDIDKIYLLVTNTDPRVISDYEINVDD